MRKIDEMVLDLLKDIYPLSLDVEEIAEFCGYDGVLVKKCVVDLLKGDRIEIDEGDKYSFKKD